MKLIPIRLPPPMLAGYVLLRLACRRSAISTTISALRQHDCGGWSPKRWRHATPLWRL
ncbi:hypothetical protein KIF59_02320 [Enterobacter cloacae subsp. cloacae]|nr:hypothetical protein [Enterobacter cloacae subsp. cloacae]